MKVRNAPPKRRRTVDPRQMGFLSLLDGDTDLIDVPAQPSAEPGGLAFERRMRDLLNKAIKACPFDREQIAAMVSGIAGREVTKAMIDSWTGATRPNRFPADMIPAFCAALGNTILLAGLAEAAGCRLIEGDELRLARLGQLFVFMTKAQEEQSRLIAELPLFVAGGRHG